MKAIIFDNKKFSCIELETPKPSKGEVLIKITASAFNPIDYQMREQELERKLISSPIFGRECSGIVIAIGSNVSNLKIGDQVYCGSGSMGSNGTYAEYITVPAAIVAHIPAGLTAAQATAIPSAGLTALQCFNRMKAKKNANMLITGAAGAVGSNLIKILLAYGYTHIWATVGNVESKDALLKYGLQKHQIIDYKVENWPTLLLANNNLTEIDIIVDCVGNEIAEKSSAILKRNGSYLDVTALSTATSREILFNKGASIICISNYVYGINKEYCYYKKGLQTLNKFIESNLISAPEVKIIGSLSIKTIELAHHLLKNNKTNGRKLVMLHP